jgi:hypothetical protein
LPALEAAALALRRVSARRRDAVESRRDAVRQAPQPASAPAGSAHPGRERAHRLLERQV